MPVYRKAFLGCYCDVTRIFAYVLSHIAKFMGPTWGPSGSCRPQMGPMLAPMNLAIRGVPGPCITTAVWRCSKPISQWQYRSYLKAVLPLVKSHPTASHHSFSTGHGVWWRKTDCKLERFQKTSVTYKKQVSRINLFSYKSIILYVKSSHEIKRGELFRSSGRLSLVDRHVEV